MYLAYTKEVLEANLEPPYVGQPHRPLHFATVLSGPTLVISMYTSFTANKLSPGNSYEK